METASQKIDLYSVPTGEYRFKTSEERLAFIACLGPDSKSRIAAIEALQAFNRLDIFRAIRKLDPDPMVRKVAREKLKK